MIASIAALRKRAAKARIAPPDAPVLRREALRDGLQKAVELLKSRRADLIGDGFITDYVALDWLEWHGGGLRLTEVGRNICRQLALMQAPGSASPA